MAPLTGRQGVEQKLHRVRTLVVAEQHRGLAVGELEGLAARRVLLAGAVEIPNHRTVLAAVDPAVARPKLETREARIAFQIRHRLVQGVEVEAVSQPFPGATLLNDQFSAEHFEKQMATKPFGIVHIASHGEFAAEASESYILTFDRELSMNQMGSIVSRTRFRDEPLELLTLSACETAAGDERASLGLAGVALRAGARSTLATLWLVHDEASARLITAFYEELVKPDTQRAVALQRAQLELLGSEAFAHPGYWSAFVLLSSWL